MSTIATRATKSRRCPVCRGDHACSVAADGLHFCRRERGELPGWRYLGEGQGGTWGLYRPAADTRRPFAATAARARPAPTAPPSRPRPDCAKLLADCPLGRDEGQLLADVLGVPEEALRAVGVGFCPESADDRACWLFPERDGAGRVVGLNRRYLDGSKRQVFRSERGLAYDPAGWDRGGPVFVVEGGSDTAALYAAGLSGVGRPSNSGGLAHLVELFRSLAPGRTVCVVGENDQRPGKGGKVLWPGKDGAEAVAAGLARALPHLTVAVAFPPAGIKDFREWFCGHPDARAALLARAALACPRYSFSPEGERERLTRTRAEVPLRRSAPPFAACPRRTTRVYRHRHEVNLHRVASLACSCWRCRVCRRRKATDHARHAAGKCEEALRGGRGLFATVLEEGQREAARKAVLRAWGGQAAGAGYAGLQQSDGRRLFLFALPAGVAPAGALAGAEPIDGPDAALLLEGWAKDMDRRGPPAPAEGRRMRPCNYSLAWRPPPPAPFANWQGLGYSPLRDEGEVLDALRQAAKRAAAPVRVFRSPLPPANAVGPRPPYAWAWELRAPPGVIEHVLDALECFTLDAGPPVGPSPPHERERKDLA